MYFSLYNLTIIVKENILEIESNSIQIIKDFKNPNFDINSKLYGRIT
jgi:hypothetical protein